MHAITLRDTVSLHNAWEQCLRGGKPRDPENVTEAATVLFDQLAWWGQTLREGRAKRPYEA